MSLVPVTSFTQCINDTIAQGHVWTNPTLIRTFPFKNGSPALVITCRSPSPELLSGEWAEEAATLLSDADATVREALTVLVHHPVHDDISMSVHIALLKCTRLPTDPELEALRELGRRTTTHTNAELCRAVVDRRTRDRLPNLRPPPIDLPADRLTLLLYDIVTAPVGELAPVMNTLYKDTGSTDLPGARDAWCLKWIAPLQPSKRMGLVEWSRRVCRAFAELSVDNKPVMLHDARELSIARVVEVSEPTGEDDDGDGDFRSRRNNGIHGDDNVEYAYPVVPQTIYSAVFTTAAGVLSNEGAMLETIARACQRENVREIVQ